MLDGTPDGAQPFPWVFPQKAQAGVEGRPTPHLDGVIADRIDRLKCRLHFLRGHARGNQRLLGVPENGLHDADFVRWSHAGR